MALHPEYSTVLISGLENLQYEMKNGVKEYIQYLVILVNEGTVLSKSSLEPKMKSLILIITLALLCTLVKIGFLATMRDETENYLHPCINSNLVLHWFLVYRLSSLIISILVQKPAQITIHRICKIYLNARSRMS